MFLTRLHWSDQEDRGKKNSVGQKQHLGFCPTVVCVSSLSSVIIEELLVATNCWPGLSVHSSQMGASAAAEPPGSSLKLSTIFAAPILVSVPGQRGGKVSIGFHLSLNLTSWWTSSHCCGTLSFQEWRGCRWTLPLSTHSHLLLDQPEIDF